MGTYKEAVEEIGPGIQSQVGHAETCEINYKNKSKLLKSFKEENCHDLICW